MSQSPSAPEPAAPPDALLVALNGLALSLSLAMAILALVINTLWAVASDFATEPGRRESNRTSEYILSVIVRYVVPLAVAALIAGVGTFQASRRGKAVRWRSSACAVASVVTFVLTMRQI